MHKKKVSLLGLTFFLCIVFGVLLNLLKLHILRLRLLLASTLTCVRVALRLLLCLYLLQGNQRNQL